MKCGHWYGGIVCLGGKQKNPDFINTKSWKVWFWKNYGCKTSDKNWNIEVGWI